MSIYPTYQNLKSTLGVPAGVPATAGYDPVIPAGVPATAGYGSIPNIQSPLSQLYGYGGPHRGLKRPGVGTGYYMPRVNLASLYNQPHALGPQQPTTTYGGQTGVAGGNNYY